MRVHSRCSRLKNVTSSFSEPSYGELDIKARKSHSLITVLDEERESGVMLAAGSRIAMSVWRQHSGRNGVLVPGLSSRSE